MNFDWKAFKEGKLVYNARTEEDAMAFLKECEKRGFKWGSGDDPTSKPVFFGEETLFSFERGGIHYGSVSAAKKWTPKIIIFSEPWKKRESVVEILRRSTVSCKICHSAFNTEGCEGHHCNDIYGKLADMVEAELEEAKQTRCTGYIDNLAHLRRLPERKQSETLEKYLARTHVVMPRWDNGEIVKEGDPYADTCVEHICVYSDGDWLLSMEDGSQLEGTLNQRAVCVEPDTQERIDKDAKMTPAAYCAKHSIALMDSLDWHSATKTMVSHLLERQRKLDAKAGEQRG